MDIIARIVILTEHHDEIVEVCYSLEKLHSMLTLPDPIYGLDVEKAKKIRLRDMNQYEIKNIYFKVHSDIQTPLNYGIDMGIGVEAPLPYNLELVIEVDDTAIKLKP